MHEFLQLFRRFRRDERGVFAVFFGLLAVVLVATAGAVVDFTTLQQARTRAQDALDSAALGLQRTIHTSGVTEATIQVKAQALLEERLANANVTATIDDVEIDTTTGKLRLTASIGVPMAFVQLVGINQINAAVVAEAVRGSVDVEVALALDITGSMAGAPLNALKSATSNLIDIVVQDSQTPNYSKVALVPYSNAVNVGSYAASVRGYVGYTSITGASWVGTARSITAASWAVSGTARTITGITRANPARVTTSSSHGYTTGQVVFISGVSGMTQINDKAYKITVVDSTRFTLQNVNSSSYSSYTSGGTVTRCVQTDCAVTFTSSSHGFLNGDTVWVAGVGGMTINSQFWTIEDRQTNTFQLTGVIGTTYGTYSSGGTAAKCLTSECEVVLTSASHGLSGNEYVYVLNASGGTLSYLQNVGGNIVPALNLDGSSSNDIPGMFWQVTEPTTNTFVLKNSRGWLMGSYVSGGRSYCTRTRCEYRFFQDAQWGAWRRHQISTCVSERVGANQYTDAAPSTTVVGTVYPPPPTSSAQNPCIPDQIVPLSSNKAALKATVNSFAAAGSTAGHIGTAWAWYMLSPNFAYLWPSASQPAAYGAEDLLKIVVIMTDGAYNTAYCNGVIAADSGSGSGSNSDHINCNATNGNPFTQAASLCTSMKAAGVVVYTVGFNVSSDTTVVNTLRNCASGTDKAYLANSGQGLIDAFQDIANSITDLRLAQ